MYIPDLCNFFSSSVPDEKGFSSPLEGHVLALWNISQLDLNFSQSQHILEKKHLKNTLLYYFLAFLKIEKNIITEIIGISYIQTR